MKELKEIGKKLKCKAETKTINERAITLVALVVTIIVLLILAGVAISLSIGNNGIFKRAREATNIYSASSSKEKVEMIIGEYFMAKAEKNMPLDEFLQKEQILYTKTENNYAIKQDEYDVTINGDTLEIADIGLTQEKEEVVLLDNIKPENYGDNVTGYNFGGINEWKIFHNDGNNVYLIAADYVNVENICEESILFKTANNYRLLVETLSSVYPEETSAKAKFARGLSDKNIWSKYYANEKAYWAIGTPTLEMLINSYNEKYNANITYEYDSNGDGYVINFNGIPEKKFNKEDNTYIIKDTNKAWAYWISTKAKDQMNASLYVIYNDGTYAAEPYWKDVAGIRPVVCLKSDVKAEKYSGMWKIQ